MFNTLAAGVQIYIRICPKLINTATPEPILQQPKFMPNSQMNNVQV